MARWVGAQGQVNSAKNAKTQKCENPRVTPPTENPKPKSDKKKFSMESRRPP